MVSLITQVSPEWPIAGAKRKQLDIPAMDAMTRHLAWMRLRGLRPATITQRQNVLRRLAHRLPVPLLEATPEHLLSWALTLHTSPPSVANSIANVACFYRWAFDEGLIPADPAAKLPRPKVHKGLPRPIADNALDIAISTAPPDVRCWLVLGAYAGLRAGEMSRLQRKDILDTAATPVLLLDGKGGKQRIVPASARVLFELRAYGLPSRGPVFRRRDGLPGAPSPARVSQLVNEHLHGLGIHDTGHAARHRFGTAVYQASKDIRLLQELLGHSDPATSAIYSAYAQDDAAAVVALIS